MKKLLALVLCVMLFVSVIPTSAFATTTSAAMSQAYKKYNDVDRAYTQFGVMKLGTGLYKGFLGIKGVEKADLSTLYTKLQAIANAKNWGDLTGALGTTDLSYNGIAKAFGPTLYTAWDNAGGAFITTNVIPELNTHISKAEAAVTSMFNGLQ